MIGRFAVGALAGVSRLLLDPIGESGHGPLATDTDLTNNRLDRIARLIRRLFVVGRLRRRRVASRA